MIFWKYALATPGVLALATDKGGSSVASAKTAGKISTSPRSSSMALRLGSVPVALQINRQAAKKGRRMRTALSHSWKLCVNY